jgi:hypothetical protein
MTHRAAASAGLRIPLVARLNFSGHFRRLAAVRVWAFLPPFSRFSTLNQFVNHLGLYGRTSRD